MVIYLAGLQAIPGDLYEAAALDGAGGWQRFRHITWPLLTPTTLFLLVTLTIASFQGFDIVKIMTQGGPVTVDHDLRVLHLRAGLPVLQARQGLRGGGGVLRADPRCSRCAQWLLFRRRVHYTT